MKNSHLKQFLLLIFETTIILFTLLPFKTFVLNTNLKDYLSKVGI